MGLICLRPGGGKFALKNLGGKLCGSSGGGNFCSASAIFGPRGKHGDNGLEILFVGRLRHGRNHYRGRDHCYKDQGDEKVMHCGSLSVSMRQPTRKTISWVTSAKRFLISLVTLLCTIFTAVSSIIFRFKEQLGYEGNAKVVGSEERPQDVRNIHAEACSGSLSLGRALMALPDFCCADVAHTWIAD